MSSDVFQFIKGYAQQTPLLLRHPRFSAVELTTYSRKWLTHTVYETKGVSPYVGWLRFSGLGLGFRLCGKVPSFSGQTAWKFISYCNFFFIVTFVCLLSSSTRESFI